MKPVEGQTFCPYKGMASYYAIGEVVGGAWSYEDAWQEVGRISGMVSFGPTRSTWNWTEYGCDSSRGRAWYRMVSIGI